MNEFQRVNHFPGSTELTRKDRLWLNFSDMAVPGLDAQGGGGGKWGAAGASAFGGAFGGQGGGGMRWSVLCMAGTVKETRHD